MGGKRRKYMAQERAAAEEKKSTSVTYFVSQHQISSHKFSNAESANLTEFGCSYSRISGPFAVYSGPVFTNRKTEILPEIFGSSKISVLKPKVSV